MSFRFACPLALLAVLAGCSSSDFAVAGTPTTDAAGDDGESSSDATADAATDGPADTGAPDTRPDGPVSCTPLAGNPATVFVDGRSTAPSIGTPECPARTIRDALGILGTLPTGKHTIKVAGGAVGAPVVYDEEGLVLVKANTTLQGDGPGRVVIRGGGPCGTAACIVALEGNAALEGVSIDAHGEAKVPLAITPGAFTATTVTGVEVTGAKGPSNPGIFVSGKGNADLTDVRATKNETAGLLCQDIFRLKIATSPGGTSSAFDDNGGGIVIQSGILEIAGASASRNETNGVAILSTSAGTHSIDGLVANGNDGNGVFVEASANLKLRRSNVTGNRVGLQFKFGGANELDLGKVLDPGKNVFAGTTARNKYAAICLPNWRAAKADAIANFWLTCSPTSLPFSDGGSCDALISYQDIQYKYGGATGTPSPPINYGDCDVGP